jgi:hypothetical protein
MNKSISTIEFIEDAHEYQKGKVCSKCKEHKLFSEFYKASPKHYSKDGFRTVCKECSYTLRRDECRFKKYFIHKKSYSKNPSKGKLWEFTIEPEDIPGVKIEPYFTELSMPHGGIRKYHTWRAIEYPKVCPVFGIKLSWEIGTTNMNSPSLDRIDPTKGYVKGNVMMISQLANAMKQNATPEQLKQFSRHHLFGKKNGS